MPAARVILISSAAWHSTWQRHQNIAVGLAGKGYEVDYIDPLPKRWPGAGEFSRIFHRLLGRAQASGSCPQIEDRGVRLHLPRLLPDVDPLSQWLNRTVFVPPLARALTRESQAKPVIVINYLPISASCALQDRLRPRLKIYDCVWDWPNDPYIQGLGPFEERLMREADLVLADSSYHLKRARKINPRVEKLEGGVDFEKFQESREGKPGNPRNPRCAFFGDIGVNIDLNLLREVSRRYPLRLIGPARSSLDGFSSQTEFLGARPHRELPSLLRDVDVLLLPYRKTTHTESILPAKTFECLATGKPTVVTGLPNLSHYSEYFYLCENPVTFLEAIAHAASEDPGLREKRLELARNNTWEKRAGELDGLLRQLIREKGKSEC